MHGNFLLSIGGILILGTAPPLTLPILIPILIPILPRNRHLIPIIINHVLDTLSSGFAFRFPVFPLFSSLAAFPSLATFPFFAAIAIFAAFFLASIGSIDGFISMFRSTSSASGILLLRHEAHSALLALFGVIEIPFLLFADGLDFFEHGGCFYCWRRVAARPGCWMIGLVDVYVVSS